MKINLAANIRAFRKDRGLTQEQLAETLGVTVGAVYKWESGMSIPELGLIVELADFFDTSVDVLLGYEMKDNRYDVCVRRLKEYHHAKDPAGLAEAEKALKKYPHIFEIVHQSATMYRLFGIEQKNRDYLLRSMELLDESVLLLAQNKEPEIGEISLYGEIAEVCLALNEKEKAMEILKKHNVNGLFNDLIGLALSHDESSSEESLPYLSLALVRNVSSLIQTVSGFVNVYDTRKDYASAQVILEWGTELLSGLSKDGTVNFLDKVNAVFQLYLAYARFKTGDIADARDTMKKARSLACAFDAAPDYSAASIRFVEQIGAASASDDLGVTAMAGLENEIKEINDTEFTKLWEE